MCFSKRGNSNTMHFLHMYLEDILGITSIYWKTHHWAGEITGIACNLETVILLEFSTRWNVPHQTLFCFRFQKQSCCVLFSVAMLWKDRKSSNNEIRQQDVEVVISGIDGAWSPPVGGGGVGGSREWKAVAVVPRLSCSLKIEDMVGEVTSEKQDEGKETHYVSILPS